MNGLKSNTHNETTMQTIIAIATILSIAVATLSPMAIKRFSRRPANGEVGRLSNVHTKMCKNAEHLKVICRQPKNQSYARHI
jgi:hypothetical protein